jgi:hypothetical protein
MENPMKKALLAVLAFLFCAVSLPARAQSDSQPLGDYARSVRKNKQEETKAAPKVYDNDNMPADTAISVVGDTTAPAPPNDDASKKTAQASNADENSQKAEPGQSLKERQEVYNSWKQRIADQKKVIDKLTHELDDIKNNATMPQAPVWPYNQKYQDGVTAKQKEIDAARAQLSDMQEQARKAGVPSSYID